MGWKDWSIWLKGGIFLGIIGVIILTIYLYTPIFSIQYIGYVLLIIPIYLNAVITHPFPLDCFSGWNVTNPLYCVFSFLTLYLFTIVSYFIIGAIIGWIIGKFRK